MPLFWAPHPRRGAWSCVKNESDALGYADAQARHIYRDLVDMPTSVRIERDGVHVHFHRRAHLPIIVASGLLDTPVPIP